MLLTRIGKILLKMMTIFLLVILGIILAPETTYAFIESKKNKYPNKVM